MFRIYKIEDSESLSEIAEKFNTTIDMLCELNGMDRDINVMGGNLLIVPNDAIYFKRYEVKKGDTIYQIAKNTGTDVDALLGINGLEPDDYIYPGQYILIPDQHLEVYVTKSNETLQDVASKMKTSVNKVVGANDNLYLMPDQLIVLKKEENI